MISFFFGVAYIGKYNGSYINISEYVHFKYSEIVLMWLLVFESLATIIGDIYFKYISNHWIWLHVFATSIGALAIFGVYFIPESPEYLYNFYKFKECKKALNYIAKFNGRELPNDFKF